MDRRRFFTRYGGKISVGVVVASIYTLFSLVSFSTAVNSPPVHEEFNPRRNRTYAYLFNEPIDNAMAIGVRQL